MSAYTRDKVRQRVELDLIAAEMRRHAPLHNHGQIVSDGERVLEVMGNQDNRLTLVTGASYMVKDARRLAHGKCRGRFVQDQQRRAKEHGSRNRQRLAHRFIRLPQLAKVRLISRPVAQ